MPHFLFSLTLVKKLEFTIPVASEKYAYLTNDNFTFIFIFANS